MLTSLAPQTAGLGWWIAIYFTLAAIASGLVIRSLFAGSSATLFRACRWGLLVLALGAACLVLDLASPKDFWMTLVHFNVASWIAWGSRILVLFGLLLVGALTFVSRDAAARPSVLWLVLLGAASLLLSLYPGMVLMQVKAPLWDTWLVPALFVVGALYLGVALGPSLLRVEANKGMCLTLLMIELAVFGGLVATKSDLLFTESNSWVYAATFGLCSVVIPLFFGSRKIAALAAVLGALALRAWLIDAGQTSHALLVIHG